MPSSGHGRGHAQRQNTGQLMSLFPHCTFALKLGEPPLRAGERVAGTLELDAPEPIVRAERVELTFESAAWAEVTTTQGESTKRKVLFRAAKVIELSERRLEKGKHEFDFAFELPFGLPPSMRGEECGVEHTIDVRLAVDWGRDPRQTLMVPIHAPPRHGTRKPAVVGTPNHLYADVVLEIALATKTLVEGETLMGNIALRSGHDTRFNGIYLTLKNEQTVHQSRNRRRRGDHRGLFIPATELNLGGTLPFSLPWNMRLGPCFESALFDNSIVLEVQLARALGSHPSFDIPLDVLPIGSTLKGTTEIPVVGSERIHRLASSIAEQLGLEAEYPVLARGRIGLTDVHVLDSRARSTVEVELSYPHLELGLALSRAGVFDPYDQRLPSWLKKSYVLMLEPSQGRKADESIEALVRNIVESLPRNADEIRVTDEGISLQLDASVAESEKSLKATIEQARVLARRVTETIQLLPFASHALGVEAAWRAFATTEDAVLVPTGPSIHRIRRAARVSMGDERRIAASIRTVRIKGGLSTRLDVDLRRAPLPKSWSEGADRLAELVTDFATIKVLSPEAIRLERIGMLEKPDMVIETIETVLRWVLEQRGERRDPYR